MVAFCVPLQAKSPFSGMEEAMKKAKKEAEKQKCLAEGREWVDPDDDDDEGISGRGYDI